MVTGRSRLTLDSEFRKILDKTQGTDVRIDFFAFDVRDYQKCVKILDVIVKQDFPPLRGIFYSAGVTRDDLIPQQTPDSFWDVFRGKVHGAWNFHLLTSNQEYDLDYFLHCVPDWKFRSIQLHCCQHVSGLPCPCSSIKRTSRNCR